MGAKTIGSQGSRGRRCTVIEGTSGGSFHEHLAPGPWVWQGTLLLARPGCCRDGWSFALGCNQVFPSLLIIPINLHMVCSKSTWFAGTLGPMAPVGQRLWDGYEQPVGGCMAQGSNAKRRGNWGAPTVTLRGELRAAVAQREQEWLAGWWGQELCGCWAGVPRGSQSPGTPRIITVSASCTGHGDHKGSVPTLWGGFRVPCAGCRGSASRRQDTGL